MITYYRAALKDTERAESAELVFLGQDWKVGRLDAAEDKFRMVLASRWIFAYWKRWKVTAVSTSTAPDGLDLPQGGPAVGSAVLMTPQTVTVDAASYVIDRQVLSQHRDDKRVLEMAKKQMVDPRVLKPGSPVWTPAGARGELVRVEFSKPKPPEPPDRFALVRSGPSMEPQLIELEWFLGTPDEDLGTLDDLIDI